MLTVEGCEIRGDAMTDKEVQKLGRKELLELLLDAQTENEALRRERSGLRQQIKELEDELAVARAARAAAVPVSVQPSPEQKQEAEAVDFSRFEELSARERQLLEREQRLWEREADLSREQESLKKLVSAANSEAGHLLQEAEEHAAQIRRAASEERLQLRERVESEISSSLRQAKEKADDTVRQAESAAALILRNAESAAAEREESAAANAELILQRAQEDANSFWKDVNELLTKQLNGTVSAAVSGGFAAEGDGVDGQ